MKEEDIEYICKVLANPELTQDESFKQWMQDKEHSELFWNMKAAFDGLALKEGDVPQLDTSWEEFRKRVQMENETAAGATNRFIRQPRIRQRHIFRWSAVAVLCLIIGYSIYLSVTTLNQPESIRLVEALPHYREVTTDIDTIVTAEQANSQPAKIVYKTIRTSRGKDVKFTLSDGTEVQLNAESSLRYPVSFNGKYRTVELNGEAYFKVARNKQHPFIVKTRQMQTRVLGTGFNVKAYENSATNVTLVEGSISVRRNGSARATLLQPGENATLTGSGQLEVQAVDVEKYTSWTNGYFYYQDTSLEEIMRELGQWYNVNIEFRDIRTMQYHFNFWVNRNEDISQALNLLKKLGKATFTFKENTITIDSQPE